MSLPDPLEFAADDDRDLHGVATWEPRSLLDVFLVKYLSKTIRVAVVLLGLVIFAGVSLLLLIQVALNPRTLVFVVLFPISVIPALLLTGYVWYTDITREPITMLIVTYLLAIVLASFPYLINTITSFLLSPLFEIPVVGFLSRAAYFYLVVGPVEEAAKLAAVVTFVYWRADFDTVVDGAVYGAIAGLGFATIENISYIIQTTAMADSWPALIVSGGLITTARSIAGPGHVIWTAIAGYYLGLAKFNREYALALTIKGLLIATVLHGTYNTLSTGIGSGLELIGIGIVSIPVTFGFILVYHTTFLGYLMLKLRRYRQVYAEASPGDHAADVSRLDGYEQFRAGVSSEEEVTTAGEHERDSDESDRDTGTDGR